MYAWHRIYAIMYTYTHTHTSYLCAKPWQDGDAPPPPDGTPPASPGDEGVGLSVALWLRHISISLVLWRRWLAKTIRCWATISADKFAKFSSMRTFSRSDSASRERTLCSFFFLAPSKKSQCPRILTCCPPLRQQRPHLVSKETYLVSKETYLVST
jgi:hypothetical protein